MTEMYSFGFVKHQAKQSKITRNDVLIKVCCCPFCGRVRSLGDGQVAAPLRGGGTAAGPDSGRWGDLRSLFTGAESYNNSCHMMF